MVQPLSPSPCNVPAKTLSDLVLGKEFWKAIFKTDPPEQLDPNDAGIFLRDVIATPHGFVTVHEHRQPSLPALQHLVTIYIEGHGFEYLQGPGVPTAYAVDEGRCAYARGNNLFVIDVREGRVKTIPVEHDLTGDVTAIAFRSGDRLMISDDIGAIFVPIYDSE